MINPTVYLPKSYHPRVSTYWWLTRWVYSKSLLSKTALTRHNLAGMPELVPAKSAKRRHRRPQ